MRRGLVSEALLRLRTFPWDSETELVTLTRGDALGLLDEYLRGELTRASFEAWAEAVEVRDDIGMEEGFEDLLRSFIFELANPEIDGQLTKSKAEHWKRRLAQEA